MAKRNFFAEARRLVNHRACYSLRYRAPVSEFNIGKMILTGPAGSFRLIDVSFVAIGGAASGATNINLAGQQNKVNVFLAVVPVAALTQGTVVKLTTATVVPLANGACFLPLDKGTPIQIGKGGGNLAGATHIDIILTYAID